MSQDYYTRNILNIKDENVKFYKNFLETRIVKGKVTKIFHGFLTYTPDYCPKCGCINEGFNDIIKWNFKRNCKIKMPKVSNYSAILLLDKQRFKCKNCGKAFTASTDIVNYHKQISNNTVLSIKCDLMEKGSEKDIAKRNDVSSCSVNRILDDISEDKIVKNYGKLPKIIGIDEFKATKDTISKMAFIIIDQDKRNIFDINNSRHSIDIDKYFRRYSIAERDKVKFITLDLYKPYYSLMHSLFRNAILVPDRFHIVLQIRNALDKTRINLCKKTNPNYNKLKKYWKLILKNSDDLNDAEKIYSKYFKKEITQKEIVTYLINTNEELYNTYKLYQGIIKSIKNKDKKLFLNIINNSNKKDISKYARKTIKTYKEMEKYIANAFDYEYSNGITEGTNNVIKQIKHTACGYRKFSHLKARVMLIKGIYNPIIA